MQQRKKERKRDGVREEKLVQPKARAAPTGAEDKRPSAACLFFCLLIQSVRSLRACLLMLSASPATAALEICCVWWTTKEEALAETPPRTPSGPSCCLLGEHVEELLGGRRNASQSFHEHQPRYGFLS